MVLAIAAEKIVEVYYVDVQTAFLLAEVDEGIYVKMTPGYETTHETVVQLVMRLGKSPYRQAKCPPNYWWKTTDPERGANRIYAPHI